MVSECVCSFDIQQPGCYFDIDIQNRVQTVEYHIHIGIICKCTVPLIQVKIAHNLKLMLTIHVRWLLVTFSYQKQLVHIPVKGVVQLIKKKDNWPTDL